MSVQKALEERKAILDFINRELPKYQTSPRDRNFVTQIEERIKTTGRTILSVQTEDEARAIVNLQGQSNEIKYYFLQALWNIASTGNISRGLYYQSGVELADWLSEHAKTLTALKEWKLALADFEAALKLSRQIADPMNIATTLGNIAICQYNLGNRKDAKKSFQESVQVMKDAQRDYPQMTAQFKTLMQQLIKEYTGYISQM